MKRREPAALKKARERRQALAVGNRVIDEQLRQLARAAVDAPPDPPRGGPPWTGLEILAWRAERAARILVALAGDLRRIEVGARARGRE